MRNVPERLVPYASATALTRTVKYAADIAIPAEMSRVFAGPTAYTLKALRIEPATKNSLIAKVAVKDQAAGVNPTNFLRPEIEGGARKPKASEAAMRYAGVLKSGQYAMPGPGMSLDRYGNVRGAEVRNILTSLRAMRGGTGKKLKNDLFVGSPRGRSLGGIWRREGKRLRPLFIFTHAPSYAPRLDFAGIVQKVAQARFSVEFEKAMDAMAAKGYRA